MDWGWGDCNSHCKPNSTVNQIALWQNTPVVLATWRPKQESRESKANLKNITTLPSQNEIGLGV